ncbi:hypothetical protein ACLOJK_019060 [Asimina triloba]
MAQLVIWRNRDLVGNVVSWFYSPVLAYVDLPWIGQIVLPVGSKDECLGRSVRMDAARRKQLLTVDWGAWGGHRTLGDADLKALLDGMAVVIYVGRRLKGRAARGHRSMLDRSVLDLGRRWVFPGIWGKWKMVARCYSDLPSAAGSATGSVMGSWAMLLDRWAMVGDRRWCRRGVLLARAVMGLDRLLVARCWTASSDGAARRRRWVGERCSGRRRTALDGDEEATMGVASSGRRRRGD